MRDAPQCPQRPDEAPCSRVPQGGRAYLDIERPRPVNGQLPLLPVDLHTILLDPGQREEGLDEQPIVETHLEDRRVVLCALRSPTGRHIANLATQEEPHEINVVRPETEQRTAPALPGLFPLGHGP